MQWMKEISKHAKGATVVLVGLKTDLRAAVTNPVSQQEVESVVLLCFVVLWFVVLLSIIT